MSKSMNRVEAGRALIVLFAAGLLAACGQGRDGNDARKNHEDAQRGAFEIEGTVAGIADGEQVEVAVIGSPVLAATTVVNGSFKLSGSVAQPQLAHLMIGRQLGAEMVLENADYRAELTDDGLAVEGGEYNALVYGYRKLPEYIAAAKENRRLYEAAKDAAAPKDEDAVQRAREKSMETGRAMMAIRQKYERKILEESGRPLLKLFFLSHDESFHAADEQQQAAMLAQLEKELGPHPQFEFMRSAAREMREGEQMRSSVGAGKPYKAVSAVDVDGKEVSLADVLSRNKLVLLEFWASWCSPCREEIPNLKKIHDEFHDRGFEIYAVSFDQEREDWLKASREEGIHWLDLVETKNFGSEAAKAYGISGLPSSFLIGADGIIVARDLRGQELRQAVHEKLSSMERS